MKRWLSSRAIRLRRSARGTTMLEAALITPLLLMLTFGIVEFSSLFYVYLALENGVSQAARYGITGGTSGALTRDQSIMQAMRDSTPTVTLPDAAFTFTHMPAGGTSFTSGSGGPGDILKVTVDYTWGIMCPLLWPFFPGQQIHFTVSATMKNENRFS